MKTIQNETIAAVFESYPPPMQEKLGVLRQLILDTAAELDEVDAIEETLKWGEPSYLTKGGSTIRIAWKASNAEHYAMFFNCRTQLVETFRELYGETFRFEGNRAIVFHGTEAIPFNELKHCISLALTYHRRKKLPLLGIWKDI